MRELEAKLSQRIAAPDATAQRPSILLIGIGNYLMGDEGIGVQFIQWLAENNLQLPDTDILDGGVGGFTLMGHFDAYDKVIFVDATMDQKPLGTISLIKPRDRKSVV